jgi:outer membrane protein W
MKINYIFVTILKPKQSIMKKLFLVAALFATTSSFAQEGFKKGDCFISGSVGFSTQEDKNTDDKNTEFSVAPRFGYFVSNNIAVGVGIGFASSKDEDPTGVTFEQTAFMAGAFGRYYFKPANKFSMFGHLGVDYVTTKIKHLDPDLTVNGFSAALSPGFNYWISNNLSLEATIGSLGFSSAKPDVDGAKATTSFEFAVDLTDINFGLNLRF